MKTLPVLIMAVWVLSFKGYAQDNEEIRTASSYTFYYLDNSNGFEADEMNSEMTDALKENLKKLESRPDNYFFLYGCNGQEPVISNTLKGLLEGVSLKKYLGKFSKESDYFFDRQSMRDNLVDYPIKVKQNVEMNLFLSAYAVKRMMQNTDDLPTPVFIVSELPMYLHGNDLKVRLNIYMNKEITTVIGEDKIKEYFTFCSAQLGLKVQPVFSFL